MNSLALLFQNKILLSILLAVVLIIGFLTYINYNQPQQPKQAIDQKVTPLSKVEIGKTTKAEIEKLPNIQKKEALPNGGTKYSIKSYNVLRPDEIIVKDNTATFERSTTPEDPKALGFARIAQYIERYGEPQRVIKGSKFYGEFVSTYVYSQLGFTVIANQYTGEVFEVQTFAPMSVSSYMQLYGNSDVPESSPKPEVPYGVQ